MMRLARFGVRHASVVAGVPAAVMLAAGVASTFAIPALHEPISDLAFWPAIGAFIVSGWVLATRRPSNAVGWLLLMTAIGLNFLPWSVLAGWLALHHVGFARWIAGLSGGSFVLDVGGLALLLPLVFPDGRLPSARRWWRLVLWADVAYMVFAGFNLFDVGPIDLPGHHRVTNPFAWPAGKPLVSVMIGLCLPMLLIGFAGSFSAIVTRWRSADAVQRAQVKWVIGALVIAPVPFMLHDLWLAGSNAVMIVALPLVPICITISVLRYRLYEIDRILSRTVTYLLVTGLLVGVYVGAVALTDRVLGFSSSAAVAASTLVAAALFQPLLRRIRRGVDRRFNREQYDATRVVESFAVRLRDQIDPSVVQSDLLSVAAQVVQPTHVSLWVVGA